MMLVGMSSCDFVRRPSTVFAQAVEQVYNASRFIHPRLR